MMSNLIDEFIGIVEPYCDAPLSFIESAGLHLVSDLLGRFVSCSLMPNGRPNLWLLLSSIPGRTRRSSLQGYTMRVTRQALFKYHSILIDRPEFKTEEAEEKYNGLSDKAKKKALNEYYQRMVFRSTIEEGTPEGIADEINDSKFKVYRICSTEMSGVFARMKLKYNTGTEALLSRLYYGEGGSVRLSGRGGKPKIRYMPIGLYVTMFAGMQQPKNSLTLGMVEQGLMRRMLINYVTEFDRWSPPLKMDMREIHPLLDAYSDKMGDIMLHLHNNTDARTNLIETIVHPDSMDKINEYAKELDLVLSSDPSHVNIYKQSLWEHQSKIAMCHRLARTTISKKDIQNLEINGINPKDLKRARKFLDPIASKAQQIIDSLGEVDIKIPSRKTLIERVYMYIQRAGTEGIKHTNLYRKLGNIQADDIYPVVKTLKTQGRIEIESQIGKSGGGVRYYDVRE